MAEPLTIVRDALQGGTFTAFTGRRCYLYTETGSASFTAELAPPQAEHSDLAQEWVTSERSGDAPLLMRKGGKLDTLKMTFILVDPRNAYTPQTEALRALDRLAKSPERLMVRYGPTEVGLWRMTELATTTERRHPVTDEPVRATASITLTRASDPVPAVGPVAGPPPPPPPPPAPPPPRVHAVARGDSLWKIAQRHYGAGALWPRIWEANRAQIRLPWLIHPGQRLVIP